MTIELTMLVYSIILTLILIVIPATMSIMENGLAVQAGPRDGLPESSVRNQRAVRLRNNMLENMVMFTGLVLVAHAADIHGTMSVLGAQIFFFARILHAIVYLAGWPWIRPVLWFISVIGMLMIVSQLV